MQFSTLAAAKGRLYPVSYLPPVGNVPLQGLDIRRHLLLAHLAADGNGAGRSPGVHLQAEETSHRGGRGRAAR